jgi:hypothetical protein
VSAAEFASLASPSTALSEWFASLNEPHLERFLNDGKEEKEATAAEEEEEDLITVSHFLPLQALCPEKRFLLTPELAKVVGSDALARQVTAGGVELSTRTRP